MRRITPMRKAGYASPAILNLMDSLRQAQGDLDRAHAAFNDALDPDLVESSIYEIRAYQHRINYLLRQIKETESLEAAVIKPLPQSDDAVYAQSTDRIAARQVRAILLLGETDRPGADAGGLLNAPQLQAVSRMTRAYLGSDDEELSRMRRFYLKTAMSMASDYVCVSYPLSGADGASQHPGALIGLIRSLFPGLRERGGVTEDESMQRMLRAAPAAAAAHAARALSEQTKGVSLMPSDAHALAGLSHLSRETPEIRRDFDRLRAALNHSDAVERLSPGTAKKLYGELRRMSITRLERFAQCPFSYFVQNGLRPEKLEPYRLSVQDEGSFFHDAVHEFLLSSMDDLNDISTDVAEARMDGIAARLLNQMAEAGPLGDSAVALAEQRRLRATARACAAVLAEHMHESRFSPASLESSFGPEDGPATDK